MFRFPIVGFPSHDGGACRDTWELRATIRVGDTEAPPSAETGLHLPGPHNLSLARYIGRSVTPTAKLAPSGNRYHLVQRGEIPMTWPRLYASHEQVNLLADSSVLLVPCTVELCRRVSTPRLAHRSPTDRETCTSQAPGRCPALGSTGTAPGWR